MSSSIPGDLDYKDGDYLETRVAGKWWAWLARAAQSSTESSSPAIAQPEQTAEQRIPCSGCGSSHTFDNCPLPTFVQQSSAPAPSDADDADTLFLVYMHGLERGKKVAQQSNAPAPHWDDFVTEEQLADFIIAAATKASIPMTAKDVGKLAMCITLVVDRVLAKGGAK